MLRTTSEQCGTTPGGKWPQSSELKADTGEGAALLGQLVCKALGKLALDSADQIS